VNVIVRHIVMEHNLVSVAAPEILSYEPITLATDIWWVLLIWFSLIITCIMCIM